MATDILVQPDPGRVRAKDPDKRRAKRLGTLTGFVFGFFALGIALAYFVSELPSGGNSAKGGELTVVAHGLPLETPEDRPLWPTTAHDGGSVAMEETFTLQNTSPVPAAYQMTATCDDPCESTTDEGNQWQHLYISITETTEQTGKHGRVLYRGPLADMRDDYAPSAEPGVITGGPVKFGTIVGKTTKTYVARIWLHDSGNAQPENVTNAWTFLIKAQTTRDVRTANEEAASS